MFSQRIKEIRKLRGMTQSALASSLGVTQQAVGKWEKGASAPDPQTVAALSEKLGVSADYLLGCDEAPKAAINRQTAFHVPQEHMIPVIGTVRAGYGALAFTEDYGYEPANVKDPDSYFYLIVKGDSMEPRISDGDYALVHRQPTLENGDLGVVVFGEGEGTLKKYVERGNSVVLQPFNAAYKQQIIAGEDLQNLYIAGKVVDTKAKW